jgi:cysteine desulfurase
MQIYLDNAATTPLDPAVIQVMMETMQSEFGNPSSIHAHGRRVKTIIEKARRTVAGLLNAAPAEIFFTSGGTEADNFAIVRAVEDFQIEHIITTPLEHHAVLHTIEALQKTKPLKVSYLSVDQEGHIDLGELTDLLRSNARSLVSIMHGNNEIGTLNNVQAIGEICQEFDAIFHSDTVQTMGHYKHDLQVLNANFMTGAAHKFHGPKGVGFLYIKQNTKIQPLIHGGAQERNMRGGTENVYGIVGLAKALEIAYEHMETDHKYIQSLKSYMIDRLKEEIPGVAFNGDIRPEHSLYTVLNASFPCTDLADMLLFNLDIAGICVSGGSACSSGTNIGSHVLTAIQSDAERPSVRFSFSKYNTKEEIDVVIAKLKDICKQHA